MSIEYEYEQESNLIRTAIIGTLTSEDILSYAKGVMTDNEIKAGFIEIVDMNRVTDLLIRYSDILKLKEAFDQWHSNKHSISIFYTPNDLSSGISEFMRPLFYQMGLTVHFCKTKKQVAKIQNLVELESP